MRLFLCLSLLVASALSSPCFSQEKKETKKTEKRLSLFRLPTTGVTVNLALLSVFKKAALSEILQELSKDPKLTVIPVHPSYDEEIVAKEKRIVELPKANKALVDHFSSKLYFDIDRNRLVQGASVIDMVFGAFLPPYAHMTPEGQVFDRLLPDKAVLLVTKYVDRGILLHEFVHYLIYLGRNEGPQKTADGQWLVKSQFLARRALQALKQIQAAKAKGPEALGEALLYCVEASLEVSARYGAAEEIDAAYLTAAASEQYGLGLSGEEMKDQLEYGLDNSKQVKDFTNHMENLLGAGQRLGKGKTSLPASKRRQRLWLI